MKFASFLGLVFVGFAAALPATDSENFAGHVVVSTIAPSDVAVPKFSGPPGALIVSPNSPFLALDYSLADSIVLCTTTDCSKNCFAFALSGISKNSCYTTSIPFNAGYLYAGSGTGPAVKAYISTNPTVKCGNGYQLLVNYCGHLPDNLTADSFFLL